MIKIKSSGPVLFLLAIVFYLPTVSCSNTKTKAGQIISAAWEQEDKLGVANTWKKVNPPVVISLADSGNLVALFVTTCKGPFKTQIDPQTHAIFVFSEPLSVRITVNNVVASPSSGVLINSPFYGSGSFQATLAQLPPGTYTVFAECNAASEDCFLANRSLTVWEATLQRKQSGAAGTK